MAHTTTVAQQQVVLLMKNTTSGDRACVNILLLCVCVRVSVCVNIYLRIHISIVMLCTQYNNITEYMCAAPERYYISHESWVRVFHYTLY